MTNPNLWNQLLVWPILNLLMILYKGFEWMHVPGPLGFCRHWTYHYHPSCALPPHAGTDEISKKMATIKPHMDALNVKHKGDKQETSTSTARSL